MATIRRAKNYFVYLIALIVTGFFSFLGFKGPAWARAATGVKRQVPAASPDIEASPSVARAIAASGPHSKIRGTGTKKRAARTGAKKIASRKSARERTSQVSSL